MDHLDNLFATAVGLLGRAGDYASRREHQEAAITAATGAGIARYLIHVTPEDDEDYERFLDLAEDLESTVTGEKHMYWRTITREKAQNPTNSYRAIKREVKQIMQGVDEVIEEVLSKA